MSVYHLSGTVSHQKRIDQNSIMPTTERPSISSGLSQYSLLTNRYKINLILLLLLLQLILQPISRGWCGANARGEPAAGSTRQGESGDAL